MATEFESGVSREKVTGQDFINQFKQQVSAQLNTRIEALEKKLEELIKQLNKNSRHIEGLQARIRKLEGEETTQEPCHKSRLASLEARVEKLETLKPENLSYGQFLEKMVEDEAKKTIEELRSRIATLEIKNAHDKQLEACKFSSAWADQVNKNTRRIEDLSARARKLEGIAVEELPVHQVR